MSKKQEQTRAVSTIKFMSKKPGYKIMVNAPEESVTPDGRVRRRAARYAIFRNGVYDPNWTDGLCGNDPKKKETELINIINETPAIKQDVDIVDEEAMARKAKNEEKKRVEESESYQALKEQNEQLKKQLFEKENKGVKKATK